LRAFAGAQQYGAASELPKSSCVRHTVPGLVRWQSWSSEHERPNSLHGSVLALKQVTKPDPSVAVSAPVIPRVIGARAPPLAFLMMDVSVSSTEAIRFPERSKKRKNCSWLLLLPTKDPIMPSPLSEKMPSNAAALV